DQFGDLEGPDPVAVGDIGEPVLTGPAAIAVTHHGDVARMLFIRKLLGQTGLVDAIGKAPQPTRKFHDDLQYAFSGVHPHSPPNVGWTTAARVRGEPGTVTTDATYASVGYRRVKDCPVVRRRTIRAARTARTDTATSSPIQEVPC